MGRGGGEHEGRRREHEEGRGPWGREGTMGREERTMGKGGGGHGNGRLPMFC